MEDRLRELWDFADLSATESRFIELLERTSSDEDKAEVLTQLGRVEGLRGDFARGNSYVDEAESMISADSTARVRVLLERGRLLRSAGDTEGAQPLFVAAFVLAKTRGDQFLAVDAAHMAALVDDPEKWTKQGLEIVESSDNEQVRGWYGPLQNNLGWYYFEQQRYDEALEAFEKCPEAYAESGKAKTLKALGRTEEAAEAAMRALDLLPHDAFDEWVDEMEEIANGE
jgi:tetratricopeptide (TPR) repeat protein